VFQKFRLFCFRLHILRFFQWFIRESGIGNGFGVKPQKSLLSNFQKFVFWPQFFLPRKWKEIFWYLWLDTVLASGWRQKKASQRLKRRREHCFLEMTKNLPKRKKVNFLTNLQTHSFVGLMWNLSCNVSLVEAPTVVRELWPKNT